MRRGATPGHARAAFTTILAAAAIGATGVSDLMAQTPGLPEVLPADFETRAALAAAPREIADAAGVWLLTASGYAQARASENGFNCMVLRSPAPETVPPDRQGFAPMCFDAEGSTTVLRRYVERSRLVRAEGRSLEDAEAALAASAGEFTPARPGVTYMASALNTQPDPTDPAGAFRTYLPHVMFLAPGLSDADVGGLLATRPDSAVYEGWPFLPGRARTDGFIVVPLDRRLRARIARDQAGLVAELGRYLPRRPGIDYGGA
jgi:hypothetical protein